jgi:uncharacterized protein with HEPN domain
MAPSYTSVDYREAEQMRDVLVRNYPEIMQTEHVGQKPNDSVFHSEANILMRIARDNGGSLAGHQLKSTVTVHFVRVAM